VGEDFRVLNRGYKGLIIKKFREIEKGSEYIKRLEMKN